MHKISTLFTFATLFVGNLTAAPNMPTSQNATPPTQKQWQQERAQQNSHNSQSQKEAQKERQQNYFQAQNLPDQQVQNSEQPKAQKQRSQYRRYIATY